ETLERLEACNFICRAGNGHHTNVVARFLHRLVEPRCDGVMYHTLLVEGEANTVTAAELYKVSDCLFSTLLRGVRVQQVGFAKMVDADARELRPVSCLLLGHSPVGDDCFAHQLDWRKRCRVIVLNPRVIPTRRALRCWSSLVQ